LWNGCGSSGGLRGEVGHAAVLGLGKWLARTRVLTPEVLAQRIEGTKSQGLLSSEEAGSARMAGVVCEAVDRRRGEGVWVVIEVLATVGVEDVLWARSRAGLWSRMGIQAIAVAAGKGPAPEAQREAGRLEDGPSDRRRGGWVASGACSVAGGSVPIPQG